MKVSQTKQSTIKGKAGSTETGFKSKISENGRTKIQIQPARQLTPTQITRKLTPTHQIRQLTPTHKTGNSLTEVNSMKLIQDQDGNQR